MGCVSKNRAMYDDDTIYNLANTQTNRKSRNDRARPKRREQVKISLPLSLPIHPQLGRSSGVRRYSIYIVSYMKQIIRFATRVNEQTLLWVGGVTNRFAV